MDGFPLGKIRLLFEQRTSLFFLDCRKNYSSKAVPARSIERKQGQPSIAIRRSIAFYGVSQTSLIPLLYEDATNPFGLSGVVGKAYDSAQPERRINVVICCNFIQNWSNEGNVGATASPRQSRP
ncbi:MAG: hypothetical protein F6J93_07815 [Oscillatoria sp. SIO1A7]|nr:hypothetical protein [Oscillatoria sp. SIO1A7]